MWLNSRGDDHYVLGQFQQALECHKEALDIARETNDRQREGYSLLGIGRVLLATDEFSQAQQYLVEARKLDVAEIDYKIALALGLVLLHQHDSAARQDFTGASAHCRALLDKAPGRYRPGYVLATALVGQAVCDSRWANVSQRAELLAPALEEYRRALAITSAAGIVGDALRDLELIRKAGIEGLEPVFDLLENAQRQNGK